MSTLLIAEAGVNHNGSLDMAMAMVDAAAEAGADVIKFQTFRSEQVISRNAPKAAYQEKTTGADESQLEMVRRLELDEEAHKALASRCRKVGLEFLSTPFDLESLSLLQHLGLDRLKISSGEITNGPLLLHAARTGLPILLSTGMAGLGDIETALGVLAFGYLDHGGSPGQEAFAAAYSSVEGQSVLRQKVTLLHCTTEYPAPLEDVNLRAMDTLREAFGLAAGYSDHTAGIVVSLAAVARGACVIEKHFTLDRTLPGPDHAASLLPAEFAALADGVRQIEKALGSPRKLVAASEAKNRPIARKSLVAACPITAGELFAEENITAKRPGNARSPMDFWSLLGRAATRAYRPDEAIDE